jgi:uncharacterized protein YfdQ (DUF2303 family)
VTENYTELSSLPSDVQAALDAGIELAGPKRLDEIGRFFSVVTPAGAQHHVVDLEQHLDRYLENPRRKTGVYQAHTGDAFVSYMEKHARPESEVWADLTNRSVTAVINAHDKTGGDAGWGDHKLVLQLQHTPAWLAWTKYDGRNLTQLEFAELLEERSLDVVDPDAATLMEITRSFKATKKVAFESGNHLSTGEVQFVYREEVEGKSGGKAGQVSMPEQFYLALAPFEGGKQYKVLARLRFSISEGGLQLKYVLDRPAEYVRTAFDEVVALIGAGVEAPVYLGKSA